jgi:hypothetical protein
MAAYQESGLRFDLPANAHFRFADTNSYKPLSGLSLKEMDFAWLHDGRLILLEVKDFNASKAVLADTDFVPVKGQSDPWRFDALVRKVTDSLMMLQAAWAGTSWGKNLAGELPPAARAPLDLVLAVGLDMPAHLKVHLPALRIALNARLQGRLRLVGVKSVALADYDILIAQPEFSPYVARI